MSLGGFRIEYLILSFLKKKSIISQLNNENKLTILRGDIKRLVTGILLHESEVPQKVSTNLKIGYMVLGVTPRGYP